MSNSTPQQLPLLSQAQLAEAQSTLKLKEDTLNKLSTDFMSLNGLNGELERKNCDREEEIARLQATIKKLSDDVTELVSTIEKLKTTLQTKSESLSVKVQGEASGLPLLFAGKQLTRAVSWPGNTPCGDAQGEGASANARKRHAGENRGPDQ